MFDSLQRDVTALKQANKDSQDEVRRLIESHARDRNIKLRQNDLVVVDHHREVRFLQEQTKETGKATANVEGGLKTVSSRCTSVDQLVEARLAAFGQFLEGSIRDFCPTPARAWMSIGTRYAVLSQGVLLFKMPR